jgi:hypothetical protein
LEATDPQGLVSTSICVTTLLGPISQPLLLFILFPS